MTPEHLNYPGWTYVEPGCVLPDPGTWVLVIEDDRENPQDYFTHRESFKPRYRTAPAKLLGVDREGWPDWYLVYVGSHPLYHTRNVSHWAPLPEVPPQKSCSCGDVILRKTTTSYWCGNCGQTIP